MLTHDIIKMEYVRQGYLPNWPYHLISDKEMFEAFIVYEVTISQEDAKRVKSKDTDLWSSPKLFITTYQLNSFEVQQDAEDNMALVIRGSKSALVHFEELTGVSADITLSSYCYFSDNYYLMYDSFNDAYESLLEAICYHIDNYLSSFNTSEVATVPDWVYSYMLGTVIGVNSSTEDRHDLLVLIGLDNTDDELTEQVMQTCLDISSKWIKKLPPAKNDHRPPTMFGEPHVIKSLRIAGLLADDTIV